MTELQADEADPDDRRPWVHDTQLDRHNYVPECDHVTILDTRGIQLQHIGGRGSAIDA